MRMPYRVIQWATGNVGKQAVLGVLAHPQLELAGCWVHGEDKDGRDVGEICGTDPIGVAATRDVEALLASDADCVIYTPILADRDEVRRIVESGKNVVTPLGWFFPASVEGAAELDEVCRSAGVTLHGTGIHPGGITERFPLMISNLSRNIRHVRAEEFSDIRCYAAEFVVREVMLFGKTLDEARDSAMPALLGEGFCQSIAMVAHALGIELDGEPRTVHEMAVATAPIRAPFGTLEEGTVAAQRFTWEGLVAGKPFITVRVNWLMGEENLEPAWRFGPEGERFEVSVQGEPSLDVTFKGLHPHDIESGLKENPGLIATAMHCVNAVPYVCDAEPGIKTYLDLPFTTGRADTRLRG
jgi:hypothetical protein